jgi:hypothetical protein
MAGRAQTAKIAPEVANVSSLKQLDQVLATLNSQMSTQEAAVANAE